MFRIPPQSVQTLGEADDDELRALVETYETSSLDEEVEIYIFISYSIFKSLDALEYLERAFSKAQTWVTEAATNRSISSSDRGRRHQILAMLSSDMYERRPSLEGFLPISMATLAKMITQEYEQSGDIAKLDQAIQIMETAVSITDRAYLPHTYSDLGVILSRRFDHSGRDVDLDRAIEYTTKAVDTTPVGHSARVNQLTNLGGLLGLLFERVGVVEVLNHAVRVIEEAIEATSSDDPFRPSRLDNLSHALLLRFERSGSADDLDRALDIASQAVLASSPDDPRRAQTVANMARILRTRSVRSGEIEHLNYAIELLSQEAAASSLTFLQKVRLSHQLAMWLSDRFDRTGSSEDLNRAIEMNEISLRSLPAGHNDRIMLLSSLGNRLAARAMRTGSTQELTRAIDYVREILATMPSDHVQRAGQLHNLGIMLEWCFNQNNQEEIGHLDQAIEACTAAVRVLPSNHPEQAMFQANLATKLRHRADQTGSIEDLNHAIELARIALDALPGDHPHRAVIHYQLGVSISLRFNKTGSAEDRVSAFSNFEEGWKCQYSLPMTRIACAWYASSWLAEESKWQQASSILQAAVEFLPVLSPRALQHIDKQYALRTYDGMASSSAAMALNAGKKPYDALRLLEIGRGVISGLLLEMRGDLSSLQQQHPSLAAEFISLCNELERPVEDLDLKNFNGDSDSPETASKRRREADSRLGQLVEEIRTQPGFSGFLLPATEEEMMKLADPGPIIITNISHYRCDAFLIEHNGIRVLELPDLDKAEIETQVRKLRTLRATSAFDMAPMLEWLWETLAKPCLDALGFLGAVTDGNWPHVWWIPTGQLTYLPFHAAARQAKGTKDAVLDRVISSYSLSLKALLYGRRQKQNTSSPSSSSPEKALLVAMPETPSYSSLPWAADELSMLESLCPSLHLQPLQPSSPCRNEVLSAMRSCKIFHFAGHGRTDAMEPARSSILLADWQTRALTMGDLRDHRLQHSAPFLGYLSACSTGATEVIKLADEGVNLIGACQLAGFRHVVGTLWEVSDRCCIDVARTFYETLRDEGLTDRALCRSLHFALRALRDAEVETEQGEEVNTKPSEVAVEDEEARERDGGGLTTTAKRRRAAVNPLWVPYVHYGV